MIQIDYSRDSLLTDFSKLTLQDRYLVGDEQSPQEAFARAAEAFADDDELCTCVLLQPAPSYISDANPKIVQAKALVS